MAQPLPAPIDDLNAILEYLEETEADDYEECDAEDRKDHVYAHVLRVREWMKTLPEA
jgi:hypothetical protein